jgi:hypothetical protein
MPKDTRSIGEIHAQQVMANEIQKRLEEMGAENQQEIIGFQKLGEDDFIGDDAVENSLLTTLKSLRANKPAERNEKRRRYAVTITEMEKVYSYFKTYVVDRLEE